MFQEIQERQKFVKAAIRHGEASAEPSSWATLPGRSGSAGASPSLQGVVNDILRNGLPHSRNDDATMESVHGFFGSSHLLVIVSCVFSTKHGDGQLMWSETAWRIPGTPKVISKPGRVPVKQDLSCRICG